MDYMVFIIFMVVYCPNDQILAHRFLSDIGPCDYDGDDDDDDVTLYVILLGRCISTNLVQRESSVQTEDCCDEDTDDHQQW